MRIVLVGGPATDGYEVMLFTPFDSLDTLPPYICTGDREPFQHFERVPDDVAYLHAGDCSLIAHSGSYPHHHEEPDW